ncbi:recombinase family protein, partial [Streptomyces sp. NPDC057543]|uniref:recombinase family protein n=1 Tax=Streptomyces sp. NPDC057543 TaxID=3346163 RepID=UPI0036BB0B0E
MELLRMSKGAVRLGIHPMTLRQWALDGKVPDRGSGLRENRPGLNRLLAMVADGTVTVVRVTHEDRL